MDYMAQRQVLFGLDMGWDLDRWTSSDDRSYLQSSGSGVSFHGHLDIDTLGGAGFASQRTAGDDRRWDLSSFAGVELSITPLQSDNNLYTLIFKDHILPRNPENGPEQSTVSWEYDFSKSNCRVDTGAGTSSASIFIPWDHFRPTYRGKPCSDTRCMDLSGIKRISIMIRSFFGSQQGDFDLQINSLVACSLQDTTPLPTQSLTPKSGLHHVATHDERAGSEQGELRETGLTAIWKWLCGKL